MSEALCHAHLDNCGGVEYYAGVADLEPFEIITHEDYKRGGLDGSYNH